MLKYNKMPNFKKRRNYFLQKENNYLFISFLILILIFSVSHHAYPLESRNVLNQINNFERICRQNTSLSTKEMKPSLNDEIVHNIVVKTKISQAKRTASEGNDGREQTLSQIKHSILEFSESCHDNVTRPMTNIPE
jgi:hypothetical protein